MLNNGLITFIRNPEIGKVKTRLASEVGPKRALDIYKALLKHTRNVCLDVNATRYLYYATEKANDQWLSKDGNSL